MLNIKKIPIWMWVTALLLILFTLAALSTPVVSELKEIIFRGKARGDGEIITKEQVSISFSGLGKLLNVPGYPRESKWETIELADPTQKNDLDIPKRSWVIVSVLKYKDYETRLKSLGKLDIIKDKTMWIPKEAKVDWLDSWAASKLDVSDDILSIRNSNKLLFCKPSGFFKRQFNHGVMLVPSDSPEVAVILTGGVLSENSKDLKLIDPNSARATSTNVKRRTSTEAKNRLRKMKETFD